MPQATAACDAGAGKHVQDIVGELVREELRSLSTEEISALTAEQTRHIMVKSVHEAHTRFFQFAPIPRYFEKSGCSVGMGKTPEEAKANIKGCCPDAAPKAKDAGWSVEWKPNAETSPDWEKTKGRGNEDYHNAFDILFDEGMQVGTEEDVDEPHYDNRGEDGDGDGDGGSGGFGAGAGCNFTPPAGKIVVGEWNVVQQNLLNIPSADSGASVVFYDSGKKGWVVGAQVKVGDYIHTKVGGG